MNSLLCSSQLPILLMRGPSIPTRWSKPRKIRSKWHTAERNVTVADVWLCGQNALGGQFKLTKVVGVNPDSSGIVRDVLVKVSPSYAVSVMSPKSVTTDLR